MLDTFSSCNADPGLRLCEPRRCDRRLFSIDRINEAVFAVNHHLNGSSVHTGGQFFRALASISLPKGSTVSPSERGSIRALATNTITGFRSSPIDFSPRDAAT